MKFRRGYLVSQQRILKNGAMAHVLHSIVTTRCAGASGRYKSQTRHTRILGFANAWSRVCKRVVSGLQTSGARVASRVCKSVDPSLQTRGPAFANAWSRVCKRVLPGFANSGRRLGSRDSQTWSVGKRGVSKRGASGLQTRGARKRGLTGRGDKVDVWISKS